MSNEPTPEPRAVTPADVLSLTAPANRFLCGLAANTYGIEFLKFTIRDIESNTVIFDVERERGDVPQPGTLTAEMENTARSIRYNFHKSFLDHKTIGAKLVFAVGQQPLPNFRMIERHYFMNRLIKSFDFTFGFCIPNSTNSWEAIYDMPTLSEEEKADIIAHPYQTKSDSYYFVNDVLVMHNKAEYSYSKA